MIGLSIQVGNLKGQGELICIALESGLGTVQSTICSNFGRSGETAPQPHSADLADQSPRGPWPILTSQLTRNRPLARWASCCQVGLCLTCQVNFYCGLMGYGFKFSANRLGGPTKLWDTGVYGLSEVWVMRGSSTVYLYLFQMFGYLEVRPFHIKGSVVGTETRVSCPC